MRILQRSMGYSGWLMAISVKSHWAEERSREDLERRRDHLGGERNCTVKRGAHFDPTWRG